jgi:ribose 5-phosphate isomerase RpiB
MVFFTARQLQELHKSNGHVTLPYRARLTPAARDWVRANKTEVGYSDGEYLTEREKSGSDAPDGRNTASRTFSGFSAALASSAGKPHVALLWWCDGPCGPAKAALMELAKQSHLLAIDQQTDPKTVIAVVRHLSEEVKAQRVSGGILLVQHGALAMLAANRCSALRAVLATSIQAVDEAAKQIAPNVLVIEHPGKTLPQVRNMLVRFAKSSREMSQELVRQLKELAACG